MFSLVASASAANPHKKHRSKKRTAIVNIAPIAPTVNVAPMVGTWTLRNGDKPRTDIKMIFRTNGTFAFVGPNWNSAGKFKIGEHKLNLEWTAVDGTPVKPGVMHKEYVMDDTDSSFTIDKYTYYKLGSPTSAEKIGNKN